MAKFIVELNLDGYDNEKEHDEACLIFIEEQLNFSASMVKIIPISKGAQLNAADIRKS